MSVLVIAEHNHTALAASTYNSVTAACQLSDTVHLLVAGHQCAGAVEQAQRITGVTEVLHADHAAYAHALAENIAALVHKIAQPYTHILASATTTGKNLLPRVAALLNVEPLSDVIAILAEDRFKRPIYAGNAIATVQAPAGIKVLTVRATAFAAAQATGLASVTTVDCVQDLALSTFVSETLAQSERVDLTAAQVVISGGRGMQSGEHFALLEAIADKLGGAVGASRAAVDAGFAPNDMQVGQTGKIVAPQLYIAVGISGAIQHLAGMKDSKVIVAINKDADAPIFQIADYGLVADLFEALPQLAQQL